jgi:hypothetical protein
MKCCGATSPPITPMDLDKMIRELRAERDKFDRIITRLEELQRVQQTAEDLAIPPGRRGRKSRGERRQVSERMKK